MSPSIYKSSFAVIVPLTLIPGLIYVGAERGGAGRAGSAWRLLGLRREIEGMAALTATEWTEGAGKAIERCS